MGLEPGNQDRVRYEYDHDAGELHDGPLALSTGRIQARPHCHGHIQQEYVAGYHAPDLTALDESVDAGSIDYLMSLRGTHGPIGKYQEDLYVARRVGDLARLGDEMRAHGIPSVTDFAGLPAKQLQTTIAAKALKAVQTAAGPLFLMLPVGTLMGNEGVLARAASLGVPIKALA